MTALGRLSRLWPFGVRVDPDYRRAIAYLGWEIRPERLLRVSRGGATFLGAIGGIALLTGLLHPNRSMLTFGGVLLGVACAIERLGARGPLGLAALKRTAAVGAVPALVGYAVLHARIFANPEGAAAFAANTDDGPLARSLRGHVHRTRDVDRSALIAFGEEWASWFPELRRATALIETAADAPAGRRERTLDRAMAAVTDGTRDRMAGFAGDVRGPATALYAFGVVVPLALIGVLPAARIAGIPVSIRSLIAVYVVVLPGALVIAGWWLLVRRPIAFPRPTVGRDHPSVPDRTWPSIAAAGALGIGAAVAAAVVVAQWTWPIALVGIGVGIALRTRYAPIVAVHERTRAVEDGLPDALYLLGRRISDGTAPETAIESTADDLTGPAGAVLREVAGVQRRLGVGIEEALLGEYGAVASLPSPRLRAAATLLEVTVSEGRPAGIVVVATATHLDELRAVERDARDDLAQITDTLGNTAAVFGPLVAGATVAMADGIASAGTPADVPTATPLPTDALGLVVGTYTLLLAAILTAIAVALERGFDRALIGERVGTAMTVATGIYLVSVAIAGALV